MSNQDGDTGCGHNLSTKTIYLGTWHSILCQEPVSGVSEMVMDLGMNFLNAQMEITYCAFENDKYVSQSVRDYA